MLGIEVLTMIGVAIMMVAMFFIAGLFSTLGRGGGELYLPVLITFQTIPYLDIRRSAGSPSSCERAKCRRKTDKRILYKGESVPE